MKMIAVADAAIENVHYTEQPNDADEHHFPHLHYLSFLNHHK